MGFTFWVNSVEPSTSHFTSLSLGDLISRNAAPSCTSVWLRTKLSNIWEVQASVRGRSTPQLLSFPSLGPANKLEGNMFTLRRLCVQRINDHSLLINGRSQFIIQVSPSLPNSMTPGVTHHFSFCKLFLRKSINKPHLIKKLVDMHSLLMFVGNGLGEKLSKNR